MLPSYFLYYKKAGKGGTEFYRTVNFFSEISEWASKEGFVSEFFGRRQHLKKILTTAEVQPGDWVLEIGPGFGALSEVLLSQGANVIALEKTLCLKSLCPSCQWILRLRMLVNTL